MTPTLVNYDYIANELGVTVETVRIYASKAKRGKFPLFPKPVDPTARSPLFRIKDVDRFVADRRLDLDGKKPRGRQRSREVPDPQPVVIGGSTSDLVGREYFAERLGVAVSAVNDYAAAAGKQGLVGFPRPVTPRSHRTPLYRRAAADQFIERRLRESVDKRGRLRALAVTDEAKAIESAAEKQIGRRVDFESRAQLQQLLFVDLQLPETPRTARGPSVSHAALRKLYKENPDPILGMVIKYRDLTNVST